MRRIPSEDTAAFSAYSADYSSLAFVFDLMDLRVGSPGGCAPCWSSLGGELVTLLRGARAYLLRAASILPNDNFLVDQLKPPLPSAALDHFFTVEMDRFLTAADNRHWNGILTTTELQFTIRVGPVASNSIPRRSKTREGRALASMISDVSGSEAITCWAVTANGSKCRSRVARPYPYCSNHRYRPVLWLLGAIASCVVTYVQTHGMLVDYLGARIALWTEVLTSLFLTGLLAYSTLCLRKTPTITGFALTVLSMSWITFFYLFLTRDIREIEQLLHEALNSKQDHRYDEAIQRFQAAHDLATALRLPGEELEALVHLGEISLWRDDLPAAKRLSLELRDVASKESSSAHIIQADTQLCNIEAKNGNVQLAEKYCRDAIELAALDALDPERAAAIAELGGLYRLKGCHELARQQYERAVIFQEHDPWVLRSMTHGPETKSSFSTTNDDLSIGFF